MLILCHNYFRVSTANKNEKDGVQHVSRSKFIFGLFLLLLVVILWVVSSELTKYIYVEKKLERPFLVTYVRSSLLFVYLLVLCFSPPTRDPCKPADYTQLLEPTAETDDENYYNDSSNTLGDSTFVPVRAGETTDSDDAAPRAVRFNKVAEVRVMSAAQAGEALLARLSWAASVRATEHAQRRAAAAATKRHLRLALLFCLPWFVSNYLYRVSLLHTSACSATIYTSATGAIALSAGAVWSHQPTDRFNLSKCVAILLTATGLVVLAVSEGGGGKWTGAVFALGSALCYAVHLLLFRRELRKGDGINAPLLVGIVGCVCGCFAWVVGGVAAAAGAERGALPPPRLWPWLLLDAALGPLLIESLWLWGRSLTSSHTASTMLGLIVPVSAGVEVFRGGGGGVWAGGAALLAGGGWAAALLGLPLSLSLSLPLPLPRPQALLTNIRTRDGFAGIRNLSELDEQSEALITPEEPT